MRPRFVPLIPIVVAAVVAGCGGSSKSSSSSAARSQSASTPAQSSAGTSASSKPVALITTKHDKLGTILAYGPRRLTVYLFEKDTGTTTSCTGACARVWPPVTGRPQVQGGAMTSNLGTLTRPDGTTQVTYKGHPLYLYTKDKDDGDTYGEAIKSFGAEWYTLAPSGTKVDVS